MSDPNNNEARDLGKDTSDRSTQAAGGHVVEGVGSEPVCPAGSGHLSQSSPSSQELAASQKSSSQTSSSFGESVNS